MNSRPAAKRAKPTPRTVAAGVFKAECAQLAEDVHQSGKELIITVHGSRIASLAAARTPARGRRRAGALSHLLISMDDLVAPIDVEWESAR